MAYEIILAPEAIDELRNLRADMRSRVRDAIDNYLRYEPTKTSKSRIKRLRELIKPQYRLRVDELRIFYDVVGEVVEILAILLKAEAQNWLEQEGVFNERSSADGDTE